MTQAAPESYRVLARKYRPASFAALIGQEAMVRTLGNAIAAGRIAHAFLLTGVRGVGKTSTARLLARALNCVGVDGKGGATIDPCGQCDNCRAIAEGRHLDVMEMDAASRTGVDDIREIIDQVQYAPVSARTRIFIIDEVHMLSKNAFNALLKTLEEPPPHVKFIFATTEIRKVPVTVLSRCQRFDLRRIPPELLIAHFSDICGKESIDAEPAALAMIARAAEGSVRDGLSLLDQAIAHGGGAVQADAVRAMLGLADRGRVLELMALLLLADAKAVLANVRAQYDLGADPATILTDLLELVHGITRIKVAGSEVDAGEDEQRQTRQWAEQLSMPALQRLWLGLSKGLQDVQGAPSAIEAAEMVLLRAIYAADLPDPADLLRRLASGESVAARPAAASSSSSGTVAQLRPSVDAQAVPLPKDYADLITLFERNNEGLIAKYLHDDCIFRSLDGAQLQVTLLAGAPRDLLPRVRHCLERWTGTPWQVAHSNESDGESLRSKAEAQRAVLLRAASAHPLVQAAQDVFPGARLIEIILQDSEDQSRKA